MSTILLQKWQKCTSNNLLFQIGMCNSDQVLKYSAVTVMIDHENNDRGKKKIWYGYSSTLGGTLSSDC